MFRPKIAGVSGYQGDHGDIRHDMMSRDTSQRPVWRMFKYAEYLGDRYTCYIATEKLFMSLGICWLFHRFYFLAWCYENNQWYWQDIMTSHHHDTSQCPANLSVWGQASHVTCHDIIVTLFKCHTTHNYPLTNNDKSQYTTISTGSRQIFNWHFAVLLMTFGQERVLGGPFV